MYGSKGMHEEADDAEEEETEDANDAEDAKEEETEVTEDSDNDDELLVIAELDDNCERGNPGVPRIVVSPSSQPVTCVAVTQLV